MTALGIQPTHNGLTPKVMDFSTFDVAADQTATVLVPAQTQPGGKIRVLQMMVNAAGAGTFKLVSKPVAGDPIELTGDIPISEAGGFVLPYSPHGWLGTKVNHSLAITTVGAAITIVGSYVELRSM